MGLLFTTTRKDAGLDRVAISLGNAAVSSFDMDRAK